MATSRNTPFRKTQYVPGTFVVIPQSYLAYRDKFKQVGKNVFVVDKVKPEGKPAVKPSNLLLSVLVAKYPDAKTLEDLNKAVGVGVAKAPDQITWRKATEDEVKVYNAAKSKLDDFILTKKIESVQRQLKYRNRDQKNWQAGIVRVEKEKAVLQAKLDSLLADRAALAK